MNQMLENLKTQLMADKKKAALMGTLFVVLLVVVGRLLITDSSPTAAVAAVPTALGQQTVAIHPSLKRPVTQIAKADISAQRTITNRSAQVAGGGEPRSDFAGKHISVDDVPLGLSRDLFRTTSWRQFETVQPPDSEKSQSPSDKQPVNLFSQILQKLEEKERARQKALLTMRKDLGKLVLQSTLIGQARLAYISGRLLHEGEQIRGFSILRIEERRVKLQKSGVTQILEMP